MADDLVPIATFVTPAEAAAARCALEAQGIVSFLKDDNLVGTNWLLGNAVGYVKLVVPSADAQRARALLDTPFDDWPGDAKLNNAEVQTFTRQLATENDKADKQRANPYASPRSMTDAESASEFEPAANDTDSRARCPACGQPRVAVCPFCRTTGGHFRAAENFNGEPEMLICPTCDEPFDAVYFRVCGACGHDFGSGLDAPPIVRDVPAEPLNGRLIAVGLGIIGLVAGVVIYFAFILS